jgi:hypothetical protein
MNVGGAHLDGEKRSDEPPLIRGTNYIHLQIHMSSKKSMYYDDTVVIPKKNQVWSAQIQPVIRKNESFSGV